MDRLLISILDIDPLSSKSWQKSTCFDSFTKAMRGHMDTLSTPDLVTAAPSEIPVDSTTAYIEAFDVRTLIMDSVSCIHNLSGMAFIKSTRGQPKAPTSLLSKDRPKDIVFIRLACTIDGSGIDDRIQ